MNRNNVVIVGLAYVIGLLSTASFAFSTTEPTWVQIAIAVGGLIILTAIAATIVPRFFWLGKDLKLWTIAVTITILAVVYFLLCVPVPDAQDISQLITQNSEITNVSVTVRGKIVDRPRLTRNQKIQFLLRSEQISIHQKKDFNSGFKQITGILYVTLPQEGQIGLYPNRRVYVTGKLYLPKSALNPNGFDFKAYLNRQGIFAGLKGKKISFAKGNEPIFALWKLQKRIVNAQAIGLGDRVGALLSSMVLGAKAVDIPYDLRDRFTQAGLAHVFAASGFQVSLLLGVAIALTKRLAKGWQLIIGLSVLGIYIGLTGIQPSILRAGLMGVGALIGIVMEREIKPLASLFLAAIILLILNPLWIWDLSFQLSFLATFGLVTTASGLQTRLDWIPSTIASFIAVPIAASVWTLPLLIFVFSTIATYSIPINVIVTPLIAIISLGGMVSATAALILPVAGSAIAWLLYYPTSLLIWLVELFTSLPGSSLAIGNIPLGVMLLIYGLLISIWLNQWCQSRWWLISLLAITLISMPVCYFRSTLIQVTVLATKNEPVIVIQDRGKNILINSGEADTARYGVIPFLASQGINHLDLAVALASNQNLSSGWSEIDKSFAIANFSTNLDAKLIKTKLKVKQIETLSVDRLISSHATEISLVKTEPSWLQFKIAGQTWLLLGQTQDLAGDRLNLQNQLKSPILLWKGDKLAKDWLAIIQPQVAIATSDRIDRETSAQIEQHNIKLYFTNRDGAVQWQPQKELKSISTQERESFTL
jgi:competence protein ComEC